MHGLENIFPNFQGVLPWTPIAEGGNPILHPLAASAPTRRPQCLTEIAAPAGIGRGCWSSRLGQDIRYVWVETERRCFFWRCDWDVKVRVVLIAVVLQLFFTFITSWYVNVIINCRIAISNSAHINIAVCYMRTQQGCVQLHKMLKL